MSNEKTLKIIKKKLELLKDAFVIDLMNDARRGETLQATIEKYHNQHLFLQKELQGNNWRQVDLDEAIKNELDEMENNI